MNTDTVTAKNNNEISTDQETTKEIEKGKEIMGETETKADETGTMEEQETTDETEIMEETETTAEIEIMADKGTETMVGTDSQSTREEKTSLLNKKILTTKNVDR